MCGSEGFNSFFTKPHASTIFQGPYKVIDDNHHHLHQEYYDHLQMTTKWVIWSFFPTIKFFQPYSSCHPILISSLLVFHVFINTCQCSLPLSTLMHLPYCQAMSSTFGVLACLSPCVFYMSLSFVILVLDLNSLSFIINVLSSMTIIFIMRVMSHRQKLIDLIF